MCGQSGEEEEGKNGVLGKEREGDERRKKAASRTGKFDTGEPRDTKRVEVTAFHYFHFSIGFISRRRADRYGEGGRGISSLMFQVAWWSFIPCRGVASFSSRLEFSKIGHSALTA